ncbi:MAG: response regulator [Deltaproteobacteria bacterium]|nr:response regulator [Deltaproteobacteria bacterium]
MRILIAEDDFTSRMVLNTILVPFGECDVAVNGEEAIHAFKLAHQQGNPYDLICLDLMMPARDGHRVLEDIRRMEESMFLAKNSRIVITTSLGDRQNVLLAANGKCEGYFLKPIDKGKFIERLAALGLILPDGGGART